MATANKKPPSKATIKAPSRGLGKGLSALMSESYSPTAEAEAGRATELSIRDGAVMQLALQDIQPGKYQPRDHFDASALAELAESIRKNGVVQPILVRRLSGGKYEIIAGERRWRAAGMAAQRNIPAIVHSFDDKKALEVALIENVQREDLNPLEEAGGYQRLLEEFHYTQEELAVSVQKSRSHIANLLRLLELPEEIRQLLSEDKITMGHARALSGAPNALFLAQDIVAKGLSVRQVEKLARLSKTGDAEQRVRRPRKGSETAPTSSVIASSEPDAKTPLPGLHSTVAHRDPDILALEETLSENLGLKVSINDQGQSGDITISYASLEQLDDILRRLGGSI